MSNYYIGRGELPVITRLFQVFDRVIKNFAGGWVGKYDAVFRLGAIPIRVEVSYIYDENHLRLSTSDNKVIYADPLPEEIPFPDSREEMDKVVERIIKLAAAKGESHEIGAV